MAEDHGVPEAGNLPHPGSKLVKKELLIPSGAKNLLLDSAA